MNDVLQKLITNSLELLELTSTEKILFLTILDIKNARLSEIIRLSELKRPTAYQALKRLKELGLVVTDNKKYGQHVRIAPAHALIRAIQAKQRTIRKLELKLVDKKTELQKLFRASYEVPRVELLEGSDKYREIAERTLLSKNKRIRYMGNLSDYLSVVGENYDRKKYMPSRVDKKLTLRIISNPFPLMDTIAHLDRSELRERCIIPKSDLYINSSLIIFDDTVVYFSHPKEKIALSITSASISTLQKTLFDNLWERYSTKQNLLIKKTRV